MATKRFNYLNDNSILVLTFFKGPKNGTVLSLMVFLSVYVTLTKIPTCVVVFFAPVLCPGLKWDQGSLLLFLGAFVR